MVSHQWLHLTKFSRAHSCIVVKSCDDSLARISGIHWKLFARWLFNSYLFTEPRARGRNFDRESVPWNGRSLTASEVFLPVTKNI